VLLGMILEGQSEIREIYLLRIEHINSLHPLDQTQSYPPNLALGTLEPERPLGPRLQG
jgi:hypothetical protein